MSTLLPFRNSSLAAYHWPVDEAKAVLAIVHGFGEHAGRYAHVAQAFNERGYAVTACDLPGHGHSPGKRGHVDGYEVLLDSVQALLDFTQSLYPGKPVVLLGHSMGGNIAANFLIRRQPDVRAAVIQAAWLRMPYDPPKLEIWLARTMRGIYPSLQVSSRLDASAISSDPAVVEAYQKDPLVHGKITPGWFFGAFEAQQFAIDHVARIGVPTLVMHGTGDRIAAPSGSADLARNGGPNLTYRAWEGLFHELHNEPQRAEVLQFMVNWVDANLR